LPVATLASASLSEASVRLPFLSSLTAEGRCGIGPIGPRNHFVPVAIAARLRRANFPRGTADRTGAITTPVPITAHFAFLEAVEAPLRLSGRHANGFTNQTMNDRSYRKRKEAAHRIYTKQPVIHSPFFNDDILLTSEGFRHLCRQTHGRRSKEEQVRRFMVLRYGLHVLKTATTLERYRKQPATLNVPGSGSDLKKRPMIQWWSFVAFFVKENIKVRVVVRKVGTHKLHFWSVMLCA
jgi:hypothetical protein